VEELVVGKPLQAYFSPFLSFSELLLGTGVTSSRMDWRQKMLKSRKRVFSAAKIMHCNQRK
jgi:hypothetical protein